MPDATQPSAADVGEQIKADHRRVESLFSQIQAGSVNSPELVRTAITELVKHSEAEELIVYPVLGTEVGKDVQEHAVDEHGQAEEVMAKLEKLSPGDADYDKLVTQLIDDITKHVQEEESTVLPRLRSAIGDQRMAELGPAFMQAKEKAPTHPHPHAPDTPPGNVVAGPLAAIVDKVKDKLTGG